MGASPTFLWGGSFISAWMTLAVNALPLRGSVAEVVLRLCESCVVELHSRIFDIGDHHRTNLIGLTFPLTQ